MQSACCLDRVQVQKFHSIIHRQYLKFYNNINVNVNNKMLSLFMISSRYMKAATIAEKINNPWSETLKYNSVILSSCIADFQM